MVDIPKSSPKVIANSKSETKLVSLKCLCTGKLQIYLLYKSIKFYAYILISFLWWTFT